MQRLSSKVRAVIFDLDGTLYDQRKLRGYMLVEMLRFIATHPSGLKELKILWDFRRAREKNAFSVTDNIGVRQFEWGAEISSVSVERVRQVIQDWMFTKPIRHLNACSYIGARELFSFLRQKEISLGVFSDYPAMDKLAALGLKPDVVVSATDSDVDRLKPNPEGLFLVAAKLKKRVEECLYIGDRDDKDGECARRAGMPYVILNRTKKNGANGFNTLDEIAGWFERCN